MKHFFQPFVVTGATVTLALDEIPCALSVVASCTCSGSSRSVQLVWLLSSVALLSRGCKGVSSAVDMALWRAFAESPYWKRGRVGDKYLHLYYFAMCLVGLRYGLSPYVMVDSEKLTAWPGINPQGSSTVHRAVWSTTIPYNSLHCGSNGFTHTSISQLPFMCLKNLFIRNQPEKSLRSKRTQCMLSYVLIT